MATVSLIEMPIDILTDILSRLPVRSLLSCQCVCKLFNSLVRDPKFITNHTHRTITSTTTSTSFCSIYLCSFDENFMQHMDDILQGNTENSLNFVWHIDLILLGNTENSVSAVSYVRHSRPVVGDMFVIGSCNGVFCADVRTRFEEYGSYILLWNPVTRQNRFLPKPQIDVFPGGNEPFLAFGFVPETNDYKVVRIISYFSSGIYPFSLDDIFVMQIEVYKMSSDTWTSYGPTTLPCYRPNNVSLKVDPILPLNIRDNYSMVSLNGAFHCLADDPRIIDEKYSAIMSFNLKDEQLKLFTVLDSDIIPHAENGKLISVDELLALVVPQQPSSTNLAFDIWVMSEYGNQKSWTKKFSVEQFSRISWPLGYWKNDLLLMLESERDIATLFLYNLNTKERMNFLDRCFIDFVTFCSYIETLVPVSQQSAIAEDAVL